MRYEAIKKEEERKLREDKLKLEQEKQDLEAMRKQLLELHEKNNTDYEMKMK